MKFHATKVFTEKKPEILMNKPICLGLSILELSKILCMSFGMLMLKESMVKIQNCEIWIQTYGFAVYIKIDNYKGMAKDVETKFDTYELQNYELDKPLSKEKIKKVIRFMKYELGGKIMTKFVGLRAKLYSYLIDDDSKDKKPKDTQNRVVKTLNLKIIKTVSK